MKAYLIIIFLVSLPFATYAEQLDPIDASMKACLSGDKSGSMTYMQNCILKAEKSWQAKLDAVYSQLYSKLTPEGKTELSLTQKEWEKYKVHEFQFIDSMYDRIELGGSMYIPVQEEDKMNVIKNRVLELEAYLARHRGI